jgi:starvation-inducible DNA-binding protein
MGGLDTSSSHCPWTWLLKRFSTQSCVVAHLLVECPLHLLDKPSQKGKSMTIDIGISEEDRKSIVDGLSHLLADTYVLYLKTHNFHWNVSGPMFRTLHLMFEEQYNELALAVDSIAERIRALGFPAPGTYTTYARLSSIKEEEGVPGAEDMIRSLVQGQEAVVRTARSIFPLLDKVSDEPTADLLTQRMQVHEKTAWMLRSMLETK